MPPPRLSTHPPEQPPLVAPALQGDGLWRRLRRFLQPPRSLKLTREGKWFIGITFGVGFAAINTGNNLLYLLLGLLLSLIVVSGVLSELSLRRLTVVRRLPHRAQVGRPHLVEIEVYNHKARVPSYAIEVEDLRRGQPADKRCFFLKISPQSAQVAAYRRTPARRGLDTHIGFRLATRFPFGLFEKSRSLAAEADLIIYPAVDAVRLAPPSTGRQPSAAGSPTSGAGEELLGVRAMREGDDPRDIYWRKSSTALVVRERARDLRHDVHLSLDNQRPAAPTEDFAARFEQRVRELASRVVAHLRRGDRVTLRAASGERILADTASGPDGALRFLALVDTFDPRDRPVTALTDAPRAP